MHILSYYINSILAVIYLTKLQTLINPPVMDCSMSIFPYFLSYPYLYKLDKKNERERDTESRYQIRD